MLQQPSHKQRFYVSAHWNENIDALFWSCAIFFVRIRLPNKNFTEDLLKTPLITPSESLTMLSNVPGTSFGLIFLLAAVDES